MRNLRAPRARVQEAGWGAASASVGWFVIEVPTSGRSQRQWYSSGAIEPSGRTTYSGPSGLRGRRRMHPGTSVGRSVRGTGWPSARPRLLPYSMVNAPAISVVICTHNRASYLRTAIDSVLAQDVAPATYEVIVVDNASTDSTKRVLDEYGKRVRCVEEPAIGLSHARNAGWNAARTSIIALLDDDAIAEPGWLRAIRAAFGMGPEPACVGGRVDPIWESPRPEWVSDQLLLSLTVANWTDTPHALTDLTKEWLVGANLAVRRDVLEALGGFTPELGRIGGQLLSGEEVHLQRRLLREGRVCWYEPRARVRHVVPSSRLSPSWFRRRYFAQGRSDAILWRLEEAPSGPAIRQRVREQLVPVTRAGFAVGGLLRRPQDPEQFTDHCGLLWRLGFAIELLRTT